MDRSGGNGRLFFAVLPDAATAERISQLAGMLGRAHGFRGKFTEPERLHLTLFFLGCLNEPMVRLARDAAAGIAARRFDIQLDRSVSFRAKSGNYPFVLTGDEGLDRLQSFRRLLGDALAARGLRRLAGRAFTPHLTLFYGTRQVEENPVEPVGWTVKEFALIHSMRGHVRIGTWPLHA